MAWPRLSFPSAMNQECSKVKASPFERVRNRRLRAAMMMPPKGDDAMAAVRARHGPRLGLPLMTGDNGSVKDQWIQTNQREQDDFAGRTIVYIFLIRQKSRNAEEGERNLTM